MVQDIQFAIFEIPVAIPAISIELIERLNQAGPFGAGAAAPRFAVPFVKISFVKEVGEGHLKFTLTDDNMGRLDAIFFNAKETAAGQALEDHAGRAFHLIGRLDINEFRGKRSVQLIIEDAALVA